MVEQSLRSILWKVVTQSLKPPVEKRADGTLVANPPLASGGIPASLLRDFLVRHATDGESRPATNVQLLWPSGGNPTVRLGEQVRLELQFENSEAVSYPASCEPIIWNRHVTSVRVPDGDGGNSVGHFTALLDMTQREWHYFGYLFPLIAERPELKKPWGVVIRNLRVLFDRFLRETPDEQELKRRFDAYVASRLLLGLSVHADAFIPLDKGGLVVGEYARQEMERELIGEGIYSRRSKREKTPEGTKKERVVALPSDDGLADLATDAFAHMEARVAVQQMVKSAAQEVPDLTPTDKETLQALADSDCDLDATAARLNVDKDKVLYPRLSRLFKKLRRHPHLFF